MSPHQATAQQELEASPEEIASPNDVDATESPTDQPTDLAIEESELPSPGEEPFQRAMQHEKENQLEEAIADCTEAIQLDPKNVEYLATRAELYGELRDTENAFQDAAKLLELDRTNLRAHLLRAKIYELSGDSDKALTEFNAAVEQNPTSWQALFERQNHFERHGQHDKALADGNRMIQVQPEIAAGYLSQALSHVSNREPDQAITYASALIQQNPDNFAAYLTRAAARATKGDDAGAKEDLERAAELAPDNAFVFDTRAAFYFETGEYTKSLADYEKAIQLQPRNYGIKAALSELLSTCADDKVRNGDRAAQLAAEALSSAPNDPVVWRAMAAAAAENGDFKDAAKWQERVMASDGIPANFRAANQRRLEVYKTGKPYRENFASAEQISVMKKIEDADQALKNGNYDRAIAILTEAIAADQKDPIPYFGRGIAYGKQNKDDLAVADFTAAIDINPKYAEAYFQRARLFQKTKQYAKARDDLLKTGEFDPTSEMQNDLAWFFATCPDDSVRDGGKAAGYVDRALELQPENGNVWDTCAAVFAENGDFDDAVEWQKAYLERKDITDKNRTGAEKRLALYAEHKPYRKEPEDTVQPVSASTTPAQPGK